jgi:uncharacterized damage-inducible protein DinB
MPLTPAEQFRRCFEYEKDSHRKVLASLETVPEGGRASEPYRKALSIFGHIIAARRTWLHRFDPAHEPPAVLFPTDETPESLRGSLEATERDWSGWLARLTDAELDRVFTYATFSTGERFRATVGDTLIHLHGHSLYHRGQIASLVRAAGGQPAQTDFSFWAREPADPPVP